jgi:hypothetical protein
MHRFCSVAVLVLLLSVAVALSPALPPAASSQPAAPQPSAVDADVPEPGVPPHIQKMTDDAHASLDAHRQNFHSAFIGDQVW